MITVLEVIKKTADFLASKGVDSPRLNAETLVGHALNLTRMKLYLQFERMLTEKELEIIRPLVRRRSQREPLQYILGNVDFSGLKLKVDKRALIARPETEFLIEKIKDRLVSKSPANILDLGTGSGAIALALAKHFSEAFITAIDASEDALNLATDNIQFLGFTERIKPLLSTWFDSIPPHSTFDLIVSNPPYLTSLEVSQAMPEVNKYEPHSALIAEEDGLKDIKTILSQAKPYLAPHGLIAIETGENQHNAIRAIALAAGFTEFESAKDLASKDRYVFIGH
jgi:release factor glutamine methyltransferase